MAQSTKVTIELPSEIAEIVNSIKDLVDQGTNELSKNLQADTITFLDQIIKDLSNTLTPKDEKSNDNN